MNIKKTYRFIFSLLQYQLPRASARFRWWFYKSTGTAKCTLREGPIVKIQSTSQLAHPLFFGYYEAAERRLMNSILQNGDVFVDVGANVGVYTLIASRRVGAKGAVYSFEPNPDVAAQLKRNLAANNCPNVTLFQIPLSSQRAICKLQMPANGFDAWSSLANPVMEEPGCLELEIESDSWDNLYLQRTLRKPTFMKIDVEGWESRVMEGARSLLTGDDAPFLMVEFCDSTAKRAGSSCAEIYGMLVEFGYKIYRFDEQAESFTESPLAAAYDYENLYGIKDLELVLRRFHGGR